MLLEEGNKYGVNLIGKRDISQSTALIEAAGNNPNPDVVKFLIEAGEDVNARNRNRSGAVRVAKIAAHFGKARRGEIIDMLLRAGAKNEERY